MTTIPASPAQICVKLNGATQSLPAGTTVAEVVRIALGDNASTDGIALAMNATVVPRSQWAATEVPDGAELELVTATQGG